MKVLDLAQMCKFQGEQIDDRLTCLFQGNLKVKKAQILRTIQELRRNLSNLAIEVKYLDSDLDSDEEMSLPF